MLKLSECKFVYTTKEKQNGIMIDKENTSEPFPVRIGDIFSSKYYNSLVKGRQLDLFAIISEHHWNSIDGDLNYLLINNKKYIVERIGSYQDLMVQLDLSEQK